jgi:hypothetical protein
MQHSARSKKKKKKHQNLSSVHFHVEPFVDMDFRVLDGVLIWLGVSWVTMTQPYVCFFKYLEMIGGVELVASSPCHWHEVMTERDDSLCGIAAEIVLIKIFSNELWALR